MRLYIKSDYTKKITFTTRDLVWKMWFKERNGHPLNFSNIGDDEMLQNDFYFGARLNKWGANEIRWEAIPLNTTNPWDSLQYENITLEFENAYITDDRELGDYLRIASTHIDILTVDRRALYIMAIEVAAAIDGQISEDNKATWLTVEEFKARHQEILSLTYEQATDISLEEIQTMEAARDPLWDEEDHLREEYIKIHGERVYEDEDDEEDEEPDDEPDDDGDDMGDCFGF